MEKNKIRFIVPALMILLLIIAWIMKPSSEEAIPPAPTEKIYIADYAEMVDDSTKEKILAIGHQLHAKYKAQIVVVTIENLNGWHIDQYANELFRKWKIGDSELNNGVLLLIAKNDRKFRIEVGYGLEGAITDGYAGAVLDGIKSDFRNENYSAGILQAYEVLASKVYQSYGGEVPENLSSAAPLAEKDNDLTTGEIVLLIIIVICIIINFRSGNGGFFPIWFGGSNHSSGGSSNNDDFGGGSSGGGGSSDSW